jgi:hypothetical protein
MTLLPHVRQLRSWFLLRPRFWAWVGVICIVLLALRIALPFAVCRAVNNRLALVEGHAATVDEIDLLLFRGAYRLKGASVLTRQGDVVKPLFAAEMVEFSLAWRELARGRIVSNIFIVAPRLQLTKSTDRIDPDEEGRRWQEVIQDLFPIEITHLEISRGELQFIDLTSTPEVDVSIREIHAVATGLRNQATLASGPDPAVLSAEGVITGDGRVSLFAQGDPLASQPRFTIKLDVRDVHLPALNDLLEAYAHLDVSAGTLQLYVEVKAAGGAFEGYLKPFVEDLAFKNLSDLNKGPLRRLRETFLSGLSNLVQNNDSDKVATRIPFSGKFGDAQVKAWPSFVSLMRNGFGDALFEGRDDEPPPTQVSAADLQP